MTADELKAIVKSQVEETNGTLTDAMVKTINDTIDARFVEIEKGFTAKKIGSDAATEDDPNKFKSLGEQLQAVYKAAQPGAVQDPRLVWKAPYGSNEGVPAEGGFLVQEQFSQELITIAHDVGLLYKKCTRIPIGSNSNSLTLYGVDETSRANGYRWGGVLVYWSDEAGTVTATKPKWREMNLKLKKLMGIAYITGELMADAVALQAWVTKAFTEEMAFKLDDGIMNGSGAGQLLGFLNSAAYIQQAAETNQATATILFENILKMWNRIPSMNRGKAEWYIIQDAEIQLAQMYLSTGVSGWPVYMPPTGISQTGYGTLMGRPVVPVEQAQTLGTVGDINLADLSQYLLIDKNSMATDTSIHVRFVNDEQTFRFIYRVDGQPLWHNTLTAFNSGTTRSPFVGLATRP